jgi:hypothetical protein
MLLDPINLAPKELVDALLMERVITLKTSDGISFFEIK